MIYCYVDQVSKSSPSGESRGIFNREKFVGDDYDDVLKQLEEHLGIKTPKRPRPVYVDSKSRGTVQVGFVCCRWNSDCSGPGPSWWEENWVTFANIAKSLPELPKFLLAKS
jgi:hypothetical protein